MISGMKNYGGGYGEYEKAAADHKDCPAAVGY